MSRQQQPPYRRSHSTPSQPPAADLYQQLIESSDLVKELDDIEAISQQISQHAEVLYQSWKNNGMTQGPGKFKLPTTTSSAPSSPMSAVPNGITDGAAGGSSSSSHQQQQPYMANGGMNSNTFPRRGYQLERNTTPDPPGPPLYQRQNGGTTDYSGGRISPEPYSRQLSQQPITSTVPRLNGSRLKPLSISSSVTPIAPSSVSGLSSPSFITSKSATLPSRASAGSSSVTGDNNFDKMDKNPDVAKSLDLLAAPEVNGSLKELVSSFVSTDRAKQAARQTIANTINNMTKRNGGFRSSSPSSSSSPFSSRAVSPLRSPSMLAAGGAPTTNTNGTSGLASLTSLGGLSPSTSTLGGGPLSPTGSTTSSSNASSVLTDINGSGSRLRTLSPTRSLSESSSSRFRSHSPPALPLLSQTSVHTKMPPMFNTNGDSHTVKTWNREPIPIPVHHVASNDGLRSPSVLNTLRPPSLNREPEKTSNNNKMFSSEQPSQLVRPAQREVPAELELGRAALPIANMHLAHVDHMKKRFEEAKQRMNLIHERALLGGSSPFDRSDDLFDGGSNGIDDSSGHSSFLFDQFRRRIAAKNKQAAPPHPELTPQQRQHIYERSTPSGTALANSQQPLRRIMSGGSVAERVMIFERCPVFSPVVDPAKESRVGTGGFPPGSLSLSAEKKKEILATPLPITSLSWKNNANEVQVPRNKIIRDIPIAQTGLPASSFSSSATSPSATPLSLTTPLLLSTSATPATTTTASSTPSITPALSSTTTTPTPTLYPVATATTTPSSLISPQSSRASSLASLSPPASAISSRVPSPQPKSRPASLVITAKDKVLPKFHFPYGDPSMSLSSETPLTKFSDEFRRFKNSSVSIEELGQILKACGYPVYWKGVVFVAAGGEKAESLTFTMFAEFWRRLMNSHHDEASQFVFVLAKGNSAKRSLTPEDFVPLIQDIVDTHPGLGFLKEATEFHSRYVHTVIARIFFVVNRSWSGRITIPELRRSNFLATLRILDQEEDINQISDFFSYEHFYVIYCKFWELDKDHDLFIDREDLARHNDHAISTRMIDRIFSGAVTRGTAQAEGKMSYTEFVWFLLAEEDKRSPTSIEYWFRCMDLDGDGFLSMYELEYFYEEQLQRMEQLGIETLPFEDCLCQMLDMIGPKERTKICLADLKGCRMTPIFFDTFFNLEKYLDHEQRDPFASQHDVDEDGNEMSDWDRFAAEEYELLVAEEGNAEGMDDMCYDDENNPEMQLDQALENEMMYREPLMAGGGSSS